MIAKLILLYFVLQEFSTDKELMENDFTFASDLFLAFSNLLRRYSTEQEKPFKQEQLDKLILKKYRKFLSEKLQTAVNNNEELKYQVYVRALGNMADLSLFNYFWASNADKLTPFQKTMMVGSQWKLFVCEIVIVEENLKYNFFPDR